MEKPKFLANPIYTFFLKFFSIMVYHRILNIVPCAIQLFIHPIYNCLHLIFQFLEEFYVNKILSYFLSFLHDYSSGAIIWVFKKWLNEWIHGWISALLKILKATNDQDRLVFTDPVSPDYCLPPWPLLSPQKREVVLQCLFTMAVYKWVIWFSKCLTGKDERLNQMNNVCLLKVWLNILVYNFWGAP